MNVQAIASNFTEQRKAKLAWIAILAMLISPLAALSPSDQAFAAGSPSITQVSPAAGPAGTSVSISGTNFSGTMNGTLKVSFRSSLGTVTAMSSTSITVTVPAGTNGLADITVETPDGILTLDDAFYYRAAITRPTVSSVSPSVSTLSANSEVTISGTGFVGVTSVSFGNTNAATFRVESASRIVAVVPASTVPGNAQVKVTNPAGTSTAALNLRYADPCEISNYASIRFAYRSSKLTKTTRKAIRDAVSEMVSAECGSVTLLRYNAKVKASTPASHKSYILLQRARAKAVGDLVETRLALAGSTARVNFAKFADQKSQAAVANWDTRKSYRTVTITNRASSTPALTASYPNVGSTSGGTAVTIKGVNLSDITSVKFGSKTATFSAVGDDQINATAPAGTGVANITLAGPDGSVTKAGAFRYAAAATITSISSSTASVAGTTTITINGSNFYGLRNINSVRFGSVNASYFQVDSPNRIVAVVPANTPGSQEITVAASGGSDTEGFTYRGAPVISSVSPAATTVSAATATAFAISGSNFTGSVSVGFYTDSPSYSQTLRIEDGSGTSLINTKAPVRSVAGSVNIRVSASGGTVVLKNGYTYGGSLTASATSRTGQNGTAISTITFTPNAALTSNVTYVVSPSLPTGLSITVDSNRIGVLSGTPAQPKVATTYTVTATGQNLQTATATFTLTVEGINPFVQNVAYNAAGITPTTELTFVGFTSPTFTLQTGSGLAINGATGVVTGTPTANGTFTITGTSGSKTLTSTIVVTGVPSP